MSHKPDPDSWRFIESFISRNISFEGKTEDEITKEIMNFYREQYLLVGLSGRDPKRSNIIKHFADKRMAFRAGGIGQLRLSEIAEAQERIKKDVSKWSGRIKKTTSVEGLDRLRKELPEAIAPEILPELEEQKQQVESGIIKEQRELASREVESLRATTTVDEYTKVLNESIKAWNDLELRAGRTIPTPESVRRMIRQKTQQFELT